MRRPRILGIAGVACVALAILLGLSGTLDPALPLLASSHVAQSPHQLRNSTARYDSPLVSESGHEADDQSSPDVNREDLQPVSYLPLVLKGYPSTTHWSGTARFGFGVADRPIERYNVDLLNADWYVRFGFRSDPPPLDLEFVQTIRLCEEDEDETLCWPFTSPRTCASDYSPSQAAIVEYATEHRGTLWLVGNEPDCPFQDCITPSRYAELYHELYYIIKSADPTAKVAIGGVVQATPLRRTYLNAILNAYQNNYGSMIPVDVWNVHAFILSEESGSGAGLPPGIPHGKAIVRDVQDHDNMDIFKEQIVLFRQWMNQRGERNKPLIVSEYGILYHDLFDPPFDEPRVQTFMLATFDYFWNEGKHSTWGYPEDENRLVQAWCWYSLDDDNFQGYPSHSHLFDPYTRLRTDLGRAYSSYAASIP